MTVGEGNVAAEGNAANQSKLRWRNRSVDWMPTSGRAGEYKTSEKCFDRKHEVSKRGRKGWGEWFSKKHSNTQTGRGGVRSAEDPLTDEGDRCSFDGLSRERWRAKWTDAKRRRPTMSRHFRRISNVRNLKAVEEHTEGEGESTGCKRSSQKKRQRAKRMWRALFIRGASAAVKCWGRLMNANGGWTFDVNVL